MMVIKVLKEIATFYLDTQAVEKADNALNLMYLDIKATEDHNINLLGYTVKATENQNPGLGILSFQKNVPFFPFFSVFYKRTFRSFHSFLFFIKECSVLSVLFRSL